MIGNFKKTGNKHRVPELNLCVVVFILIIVMVAITSSAWAERDPTEYKVKAAIIYKFINFIQWPEDAYDSPNAPVTLCVLGKNPFEDSFGDVIGEDIQDRKFAVTYLQTPGPGDSLDDYQILFFPSSMDREAVQTLLANIAYKPVITIGEQDGFLEMGGMINFVNVEGKVKFEVNVAPAKKADLKVRSRLLRIAVRVLGDQHAR